MFATLVLAVSNALMSLAGDWHVALALRVVDGLAGSAYGVASLAMLGDVLEGNPKRPRIIGAYRMAGSLAFSVAIASVGLLVGVAGLPVAYQFAAIVNLLACLVSVFAAGAASAARGRPPARRSSLLALARGPMRPTVLVVAAFLIPFSAVFSVWPIWVSDVMGFGKATFSQLWALAAFIEVPGMLLAGYVVSRRGWRTTFAAGLVLWMCVYGIYGIAGLGAHAGGRAAGPRIRVRCLHCHRHDDGDRDGAGGCASASSRRVPGRERSQPGRRRLPRRSAGLADGLPSAVLRRGGSGAGRRGLHRDRRP